MNSNTIMNLFKNDFTIIAGPCSIESLEQLDQIAQFLNKKIIILRGGSFKPRTTPDTFQGLHKQGLEILKTIKDKYNFLTVSEITAINQLEDFRDVDILQVGARNMQNFELLKALGQQNKPVLLKRGMGNTVDELLGAAQYIKNGGNNNIILCERGIRTFETSTRFTLDISAIPVLKSKCDYPIIVDPSHAAGQRELVIPLSKAAKAVGANGLIVEVHNDPDNALTDPLQQLTFDQFEQLIEDLAWIR